MNTSVDFQLLCSGNVSTESNSTSELWLVADKVTGQILAAFLLLILVVGLPWNLLVVLTIVKEKLYHQPTIVVLLCLTLSNIFLIMGEFPVRIVTGFSGEYIFGSTDATRCTVCTFGAFGVACIVLSLYIIATLAFDRFLFIYKPLHYEKVVTSGKMALALVSMLTVVFITLTLPPWIYRAFVFNPILLACSLDLTDWASYYLILVMILAVIPVLLLVVFNVWVVVIVQKNIRAIYGTKHTLGQGKERDSHQNELNQLMRKKKHQKQLHLFNVFGALLGSCLATWLPLIIVLIYAVIIGIRKRQVSAEFVAAFYTIFVSQVAVYPIVETIVIKDVREPLKKLVFCCCWKTSKTSELSPEESGRSQLCESSSLGCCGKLMKALHYAVLEHYRHSHTSDDVPMSEVVESNSEK